MQSRDSKHSSRFPLFSKQKLKKTSKECCLSGQGTSIDLQSWVHMEWLFGIVFGINIICVHKYRHYHYLWISGRTLIGGCVRQRSVSISSCVELSEGIWLLSWRVCWLFGLRECMTATPPPPPPPGRASRRPFLPSNTQTSFCSTFEIRFKWVQSECNGGD